MALPKPYYQNSKVTVYHGNSLEIVNALKDNGEHFDLLLTDPPYGINQLNSKGSGINMQRGKAKYKDGLFDDTPEYLRDVVRPIIDASLSICDLGIITGGVGSWSYLPPPTCEGCMYMPASPSFNRWGHQDYQPIYYYGQPHGNTGKYRVLSHQVTERGFCKEHPCAKPLELWRKLVLCGTDGIQGKRVLDPFGGSGTTGEACQSLGMHSVLIELNERYCELIAKNCAQEYLL